jgi:hypothetical protein
MASFFGGVLQLGLAVTVATAYLIPTIKGVNTSTWTAPEIALWALASLAVIAGVINGILNLFGLGA